MAYEVTSLADVSLLRENQHFGVKQQQQQQTEAASMGPSLNMMKWWAKHGVEKGRMTRHLSPYEVSPVRTLINTIPQKTVRKIQENGAVLIPAFVLFVGTVKWGVAANDEHHREHWS